MSGPATRIVIEPPSTLEPLSGGGLGLGQGLNGLPAPGAHGTLCTFGAAAAAAEQDAVPAEAEEVLPDDVPLTRAQLTAKVSVQRLLHAVDRLAPCCACPHSKMRT